MKNNQADESYLKFEKAMHDRIALVDSRSKGFKKNFQRICKDLELPSEIVKLLIKLSITHTACFTYTCINDAYREIKIIQEGKGN